VTGVSEPDCLRIGSLPDRIAINGLLNTVPPRLVEEVIAETCAGEQRTRQMPAWLTMYFTLALWLWPDANYSTVLSRLLAGMAWAGHDSGRTTAPVASSVARARDRLGPDPLRILFHRLIPSTHTPAASDGCWRGLPLRSLDNTVITAPGRCGFPAARIEALADGDGVLTAAAWAPTTVHADDLFTRLFRPLFRAHAAHILILANGLPTGQWSALRGSGVHLVTQAPSDITEVQESLSDGSHLTHVHAMPVRIIHSTGDGGKLATTLTDPTAAPAAELARVYAERWQGGALTEQVTGHAMVAFRSQSAYGIDQEIWALLCLYQALARPARRNW
jgi:hypothetical protein